MRFDEHKPFFEAIQVLKAFFKQAHLFLCEFHTSFVDRGYVLYDGFHTFE